MRLLFYVFDVSRHVLVFSRLFSNHDYVDSLRHIVWTKERKREKEIVKGIVKRIYILTYIVARDVTNCMSRL